MGSVSFLKSSSHALSRRHNLIGIRGNSPFRTVRENGGGLPKMVCIGLPKPAVSKRFYRLTRLLTTPQKRACRMIFYVVFTKTATAISGLLLAMAARLSWQDGN